MCNMTDYFAQKSKFILAGIWLTWLIVNIFNMAQHKINNKTISVSISMLENLRLFNIDRLDRLDINVADKSYQLKIYHTE